MLMCSIYKNFLFKDDNNPHIWSKENGDSKNNKLNNSAYGHLVVGDRITELISSISVLSWLMLNQLEW